MDANSRVAFAAQAGSLKLNLTEGSLLLDVQEKLDADESLEIETSAMSVGIRGTIVYVRDDVSSDGSAQATLGVLEGTAEVTYTDQTGVPRVLPVPAGRLAVVNADSSGVASQAPQTEAPKTEAPQAEAPKTEAPQTEAPKTEAPQTEAPQTEAPKAETAQTEAPKTEAPQTEAPKADTPKVEEPDEKASADEN